ncbi:hypothetical protein BD779DRAFT_792283 [Infundibulicybe gibba]|nr:hypothetical protein BD779DRAFT_792283 [Infundibulicybe gibba]
MSSQSNRKPVFLVRSISKWAGACLSSLPKVEVKRTKRGAPPAPRVGALASAKAAAPVLKPLRLVEKLLRGDIVVPLPRSAKRSGLRSLVIVEQLNESAAEVSHPLPAQEPLDAPVITGVEPVVMELPTPTEVASFVSRPAKQIAGSSKSIDTVTPPGTTQSPKATTSVVKATKATSTVPRKNSSATLTKAKPDLGVKSGPRRTIKDSGDVPKPKKPASKSGPSTTFIPKPNRPTAKSVTPKAAPRAVPSKLMGSSTPVLEKKQSVKASKPSAPALRAKSTSASGGKISPPTSSSRAKPVHKPLVAARPRVPAPSPHAKATVAASPAPRRIAKPISNVPATKGIARKPVGGKAPPRTRVGTDTKLTDTSIQDVPTAEVVSAEVVPVQVTPVVPQEPEEPRRDQRALACSLGDISNIPKIGARAVSSTRDTPKESPKEGPADMRTDFIGELKDRLAARKSRPSGPFTSFPKGSCTPESSQKDFRSILRSASASKRFPEPRGEEEEASELQRVFQKRGNKISALASRI